SEDLPAIVEVPPPLDERLRFERRLNEPEVCFVLPRWDGAAAASGDAERELGVRVCAGLCEHLSHREVRAATFGWIIAAYEQEVAHAVCGSCEEVSAKAEQVAVAAVDARDGASA